jgi:hypothetical protein
MKLKKNEIWKVSDRHGNMIIRLKENVDTCEDTFFKALIIRGSKSYASIGYNLDQKLTGLGTSGTIDTFRTTLCTFQKKMTMRDVMYSGQGIEDHKEILRKMS